MTRPAVERPLDTGQLGAFGTDVWWREPADPSDTLLAHPRVYAAPHMGGNSVEALDRTVALIEANLARLERGEPVRDIVN